MLIDFAAVDRLKFELLDLSTTLSSLSTENEEYFKNLQKATERVKFNVFEALDTKGIKRLDEAVALVSKKAVDFNSLMKDVGQNLSSSALLGDAFASAADKFKEMSSAVTHSSDRKDSLIARRSLKGRGPQKVKSGDKNSLISRELNAVKGLYKKSATKLKLPSVGNVAATGIMWMAYGVMEEQRLKAMLGKAKNIIISSVDGTIEESVKKGSVWLRDFAEAADKFYAISNQEVMNLGKVFTEAGFSIEETLNEKIGPDIREGLHGNFASLTLALDKVFELTGGTMAAKAVDYAQRYGMSLKDAYGSLEKMAAIGRSEDGVGSMFFLKNVEKSLTPLEKMGYTVENVVEVFDVMQKRFTETFGVPKHLSAKVVGEGVQQITEGMSKMSPDWQIYMAKALGYGNGDALKGRIELIDSMKRLANKDDNRFTEEIVKIVGNLKKDTGGNDALIRTLLEKGPKWGVGGSRLAMEIYNAVKAGNSMKTKELKAKIEELKGTVSSALKTEQEKMMGVEKEFHEFLVGLREVGIGLFGLLGNALVSLIANVKAVPALLIAAFQGKKGEKKAQAIHAELASFSKGSGKNIERILAGLQKMIDAGMGGLKEVLGETFTSIRDVILFDPGKSARDKYPHLFPEDQAAKTKANTQVVFIPVASNSSGAAISTGEFDVPMPQAPEASAWDHITGKAEKAWVGGKLVVRSYGVDELGRLAVGVTGTCPRCGLAINSKAPEVREASATSLLGPESVSGKVGKAVKSDASSRPFGMIKPSSPASSMNPSVFSDAMSDEEALARVLASEPPRNASMDERLAIGHTILNRMKKKKYEGKSLRDVVTGGEQYGPQGGRRAYATTNPATEQTRALAKKILSGETQDPTGGATHFYHSTRGQGYGNKKDITRRHALPAYTQDKNWTPTATYGSAVFGGYGRGLVEDPEAVSKEQSIAERFDPTQESKPIGRSE